MKLRVLLMAGIGALIAATSHAQSPTICPDNFKAYAQTSTPLSCTCSAEATQRGIVAGMDVYTGNSSVCKAALHAGVVGATGGPVTVIPEAGREAYPGVTRNGVRSGNHRSYKSSFRFAAVSGTLPPTRPASTVSAAVDAAGRPIQAPIAETLRTQRKVQVYINFITDKADLQPSAEPVLRELFATLKSDQTLRVDLIGHTDSVGSSEHNKDLSERRAATVYFWLVRNGIERDRLRSNGRGFTEPIADNATAEGRALNRRVEVKAID